MKKTIAALVIAGIVPAFASAVGNHPMAGCGLGYLLLSNKDNSKATQVFGATTNATGVQTFGITSGTSGCTEDGAVKLAKETEVFAEVNLPNLRQEMAAGSGPYVTAFATLIGASEAQRPTLIAFFKSHYSDLFPSESTTSSDMLTTLKKELAMSPAILA